MLRVAVSQRRRFDGYVAIVTDRARLVLPVGVEGQRDGVHVSPAALHLGTLIAPDAHRRAALRLLNAGAHAVRVLSAHVEPRQLVGVDVALLDDIVLPPHAPAAKLVARLSIVAHPGAAQLRGTVVILTNDTDPLYARIRVPFDALVLDGCVTLAPRDTSLLARNDTSSVVNVDDNAPLTLATALAAAPSRTLRLRNAFSLPLAVLNVSLSSPAVQLVSFEPQVVCVL
jgi:hypothetical protein